MIYIGIDMIYIGIDPGKKGALAYMMERHDGGYITNAVPMDMALVTLRMISRLGKPTRCCLEKVHAMPKQGVSSTFTFGTQYGWIKGQLDAYGVSYQEIPPEKWKKEFGLNTDKQKSIEVCRKLFPEADLRPSDRCRVDSDGMAEALLMAEYARRKL